MPIQMNISADIAQRLNLAQENRQKSGFGPYTDQQKITSRFRIQLFMILTLFQDD